MKQMEVTIMGQSYILACPEGGENTLLLAVDSVDREMCAIRDAGRVKARERIAVLAALNLAYALAERPVPPAAPAVEAGSPTDVNGEDWNSAASKVDVPGLIARLDTALGGDGQLL